MTIPTFARATRGPIRWTLPLGIALSATPIAAVAVSPEPPTRTDQTDVEILTRGDGPPIVLRWRPTADRPQVIQVGTRTVPSVVESPGLEDTDAPVRLAGFMRPPIEKLFTLQGRLSRVDETAGSGSARMEIRWRVVDAAARLFGIRPAAMPEPAEPTDADDAEGPGTAPPAAGEQPSTEDLVSSRIRDEDRLRGSEPEALETALQFERITNQSLQKIDGAAITQTWGIAGVLPSSTVIRLAAPDRRADFEASGLGTILSLAQPSLPGEPLAVGGSWKTRSTAMVQSVPVTTEAVWTIASFDAAADATGVAAQAVLRVEFTRRADSEAEIPPAIRGQIDADGRGEVTITLDAPTRLEGRFVQTPIAEPRPGRAPEVTRMRLDPIESR